MRILHVIAQKPDSTGSGVCLHQLVSSLCSRGIEQAVLCGIDDGDSVNLPAAVRAFPVVFNTPQLPFHLCGMSDEMPYPSTRYRDLTPPMLEAWKEAYRAAIRQALSMGQAGDVIVLMGKGHEDYQEINGVKHHLDEYEEVMAYYQK